MPECKRSGHDDSESQPASESVQTGRRILRDLGVEGAPLVQQLEAAAEWLLALSLGRAEDMQSDRAMHAACEAIAQARALAVVPVLKGTKHRTSGTQNTGGKNDEDGLTVEDIRAMIAEARGRKKKEEDDAGAVIKVQPSQADKTYLRRRYDAYVRYTGDSETDSNGSS